MNAPHLSQRPRSTWVSEGGEGVAFNVQLGMDDVWLLSYRLPV